MKIISIDVGIKNLAYCLLDLQEQHDANTYSSALNINIIKWDSINLCEKEGKGMTKNVCHDDDCKKKAKYYFYIDAECAELDHKMYICSQHAKKIENKQEIVEEDIEKIKEKSANKMDLVSIGVAIKKHFDTHFSADDNINNINHIVIENQISPIATRMKTIQGMIMQYFIMKGITSITFASAINKLKAFTIDKKTSYKDRKKLGIEVTKKILTLLPLLNTKTDYFINHQKKDDLADSFLQGVWYLQSIKKLDLIKI
jgi:hypothetical protein